MRRAPVLLAVVCLTLVACSDDGGGGGPAVADQGDGGPMAGALALVPEGASLVVVNDYAAAGEALDLERPAPDEADEDSVADWFIPLTIGRDDVIGGLQPAAALGQRFTEDEAWREEVGWAPVDADLSVEVQDDGELFGYTAFTGDFDPDTIEEAVTDDENVWADQLETDEHGDVEYYRWDTPDDRGDFVTVVRPVGEGSAMAVLDGALLWSREADALEDGIDAATGEAETMADDDELALLAEAMDELGAQGAAFSTDEEVFSGPPVPDLEDLDSTVPDNPLLQPYESFALGARTGEGGPQVLIALLHDDEDAAAENVEALEEVVDDGLSLTNQPWSDLVSIDEAEADGSVLTAVLDLEERERANLWINILFTRDTLLAS